MWKITGASLVRKVYTVDTMRPVMYIVLGALLFTTTSFALEQTGVVPSKPTRADKIAKIQRQINLCEGKGIIPTGRWNLATSRALKSFHRSLGLPATGALNNSTVQALEICAESKQGKLSAEPASTTSAYKNSNSRGTLVEVVSSAGYNNSRIIEGQRDIPVMGVTAVARDGDTAIDSFVVSISNTGGGERRFDRIGSDVSVWLDGVEIGRKLASEYSSDIGDTYLYRFYGLKSLVSSNKRLQLELRMSAKSALDTAALSGASWKATTAAGYLGTVSSSGKYQQYGEAIHNSFSVQSTAGGDSSETAYRVTPGADNPPEQTIIEWGIEDQEKVHLLSFDVATGGTDMILERLPITLTTTANDIQTTARRAQLYANGEYLAEVDLTANTSQTTDIVFGATASMRYPIPLGNKVNFQVFLHLNDMYRFGDTLKDFEDGETLVASYTSANIANTSLVTNSDVSVRSSNRFGSAIGNIQTFYNTGAVIEMGKATVDSYNNGAGQKSTLLWQIPMTITSVYDQLYMGTVAEYGGSVTGAAGLSFGLDDYAQPGVVVTSTEPLGAGSSVNYSLSSNAPVENNVWRFIPEVPHHVILNVSVMSDADPVSAISSLRPRINGFKFWLDNDFSGDSVDQLLTTIQQTPTGYSSINNAV